MHSILPFTAIFVSVVSLVGSQSIDPASVPLGTRDQWCRAQISSCPLICLQLADTSAGTDSNSCDATTLTYSCVCSNGQTPNASEYSQTIPYFICTESNNICVNSCGGVSSCQASCRDDHPCGAQNPTRVNTSTISTMSATSTGGGSAVSTASDGAVYTGFGGSAATSAASDSGSNSGTNAAATLLDLGQVYGLGVVASGIFAGFALLL